MCQSHESQFLQVHFFQESDPSLTISSPSEASSHVIHTPDHQQLPYTPPPPKWQHSQAAAPDTTCVSILFHLLHKPRMTEMPTIAIQTANAALMPAMYATKTPGICSAVKTARSCVAPVAMRVTGLTFGELVRSLMMMRFTNAACAAEMANAPPMVWKTASH